MDNRRNYRRLATVHKSEGGVGPKVTSHFVMVRTAAVNFFAVINRWERLITRGLSSQTDGMWHTKGVGWRTKELAGGVAHRYPYKQSLSNSVRPRGA